ncbi:methionyl-tRNA formyltransferase [Candidatus Kaiserbacteria bacterium]|nr:methionyl-tRNA formyltransferase [Candidatus Kaiserbacteria bacterium]
MRKSFRSPRDVRFAFFGTPHVAVIVLDELARAGFMPSLIITRPDTAQGRGKVVTAPPVALWATKHGIPISQPIHMTNGFIYEAIAEEWDVFVVAAYGKILPQALLDIPAHGTLNVHPSLLPHLRGPSPIRSAILNDERDVGVTIIQLDAEMDHGPIVEQEIVDMPEWPPRARELEDTLAHEGGKLLAHALLPWVREEIAAQEQDHTQATYCKPIKKEDGLIDLSDDPYQNLLKIRAFEGWPGTYTFFERNGQKIRVQIIDAHLHNDALVINIVRPEGKRDMPYVDFLRSGASPLSSSF